MNLFRLFGDMAHLLAQVVLLRKLLATKSCKGLSLKSQELYALVYVCRYLDLLDTFISVYNSTMKIIFLSSTFAALGCMRFITSVRQTYDRKLDAFRRPFLVLPCVLLALGLTPILYPKSWFGQLLWAASIYMEAGAILPQLVLMQRVPSVDSASANYVFLLGVHRIFYIFNWGYRLCTEPYYRQWPVWASGFLQATFFLDYFKYYFREVFPFLLRSSASAADLDCLPPLRPGPVFGFFAPLLEVVAPPLSPSLAGPALTVIALDAESSSPQGKLGGDEAVPGRAGAQEAAG